MTQRLQRNDGYLAYDVRGDGFPVVLGHAGFVDRRMWDAQVTPFSERYRVIRYDMRGFGESSQLTAPVNRRNDLLHLLDHLDIEQAILVGCSMSGEIILDLALAYPERVAALVLVTSVPSGFTFQGEMPTEMVQLFEALQANDVERAVMLQNQLWISGPYREQNEVAVEVWQKSAEMGRIPVTNQTLFAADMQPFEPLNPPAISRLDEIACPTLVVTGALDHAETVRGSTLLAEEIPYAEHLIMSDAAHLPSMERPNEFNRAVLDFLSRITLL